MMQKIPEMKVVEFSGGVADGLFRNIYCTTMFIDVPGKIGGYAEDGYPVFGVSRYSFNGKHSADGTELWELVVVQ